MSTITLIAAVAENGVIGKDGDIPWHEPTDLQHFKETTMGHPCIMGRTTYEGIVDTLGEPLPGRTSIVLSFDDLDVPDDVINVHSIADALEAAQALDEVVYIIGGATVYEQFLDQDLADRMILTEIPMTPDGDTSFPEWDDADWNEVERREEGELAFVTYERAD